MPLIASIKADVKFLTLQFGTPAEEYIACLKAHPEVVVICVSNHQNRLGDQRALVHEMMNAGLKNPVVFAEMYQHGRGGEERPSSWEAAADMGALMIDGLTDGIWLMNNGDIPAQTIDETAFGILQAAASAHQQDQVYQVVRDAAEPSTIFVKPSPRSRRQPSISRG